MPHHKHLLLNKSNDRSQVVITSTLIIKKKAVLVYFHVRSRYSAQRGNQENGNQYARPGFQRVEGISEQN